MNDLNEEQVKAYKRFIRARNNVALGQYRMYNKNPWQPCSDVVCSVDEVGLNHQLFLQNDEWLEYKEAFEAWVAIEPVARKDERMSMIRGDYGDSDNWQEKKSNLREVA
jgi:hypothetical protein